MLEQLDLALLLQVTSLILGYCFFSLVFHQHFHKGSCTCSCEECEEARLLERRKKCFRLTTVTKMSVLAGQGSNVSSWQELVQLLEDVHSVHRASSVLCLLKLDCC